MTSRLLAFSLLLILGLAPIALALAPAAFALPAPEEPLPIDSEVRIGRLENGITFYIRPNRKPENLAEIRLAVNAGSLLEEDDQQGLAHFLEHMAFNGTEHFAGNELISFLESIGSRFGPDINAFTSMEETVYLLEVPTDRDGLLEKGLMVLRDWAGGMTIDPEEVEKERGVILEEWRLGQGAQQRVRNVQWPVLYRESRYAERLPIGKMDVIENAPAQRLRDFYEDWYQPQLMAVVAVGDFDPDSVETMIRDAFGDMAVPAEPSELPEFDVPGHDETLVSVASDEELSNTRVSLAFKHPRQGSGQVQDYRRGLVVSLFSSMLNARFSEITELPDAPFLFAGAGAGSGVRPLDMFRAYAVTSEGEAEGGLSALLTEIARVRAHGFGDGELDRSRARFRASLERSFNERDKTESGAYAREYAGNFLDDEPIPGIAYEYETGLALLDDITLAEVNSAIDRLVHEDNMVILVSGPQKDEAPLPTEEALLTLVLDARGEEPPAYVDDAAATSLLRSEPVPGTVTARGEREALGVTVLSLSNGMEVWLKPTDFKNDQIIFGTKMLGGMCLADSGDVASANLATAYVGEAGYGGWTPTELRKMMAGKLAGASASIAEFEQGLGGSSTPADLETALQILYIAVTDPTERPEAFDILTERYRSLLENRLASPEARYVDVLRALNVQNHYMFRPPTVEWLDRADPETALAFYRERMDELRGCRFFFVGAFDPAEIEPLILRYIGSLPAATAPLRDEVPDIGLRFPEGVHTRVVHAGTEPKARVAITWPALTGLEEIEVFRLRMAGTILQVRLREILREELGGTYSVQVGSNVIYTYPHYGSTTVTFGCAPENAEGLVTRVFEEVDRFKREGPDAEEVAKIQEQEHRSLEKGIETNGYWLASFQTLDILGWDQERILARGDRIDSLTPENLRETVARYYPSDNHTTVTLLPETE